MLEGPVRFNACGSDLTRALRFTTSTRRKTTILHLHLPLLSPWKLKKYSPDVFVYAYIFLITNDQRDSELRDVT